ncbi:MAG: ARMT1-like domain-containing protein [Desulfurobacteriaceae bacterium]
MKVYPECLPCFLNQIVKTSKACGLEESKTIEVEREVAKFLYKNLQPEKSPGYNATFIHRIFKERTKIEDPFKALKEKYNSLALKLEPILYEEYYLKAKNRVEVAVRLAALGNVIDFGVPTLFDLEEEIKNFFKTPFAYYDEAIFERFLVPGKTVLYLADNAGEIVFDKFLVRELKEKGLKVVLAVRGAPVLNDATVEDAIKTKIAELVDEVIDSGSDVIGIDLERAPEKFKEHWKKAYFIISKGQANFETLDGIYDKDVFFILKAKCDPVAKELRCKRGELIFLYNKHLLDLKEGNEGS